VGWGVRYRAVSGEEGRAGEAPFGHKRGCTLPWL
jgi:hypothetical protein